ncbi:O-antigen ligase family protein [Primorskyibacter sp. 2E107]|uniref:O-antigen ligase family protein n=1 Tax=Primorskyibacter sp. 2E107 TaxID=3403458 RepID=UPI003AF82F5C
MAVTEIRSRTAFAPGEAVHHNPLSLVVVAYLMCILLPLYFRLGPLAMGNLKLLALIMTVPLLIRTYMGHFGRIRLPDILFPGFIFWSMLALVKNNPSMAVENTGSTALEMLGGYLIGRAYIRTPEQFLQLCRYLMFMVFFLMPFAFIEALTGRLLLGDILSAVPGMNSITTNVSNARMGLDRVQAVFAHPIHFGLFCSVALSMSFVALKGHMPTGRRYIISVLMLITGCLALSSGALLAMLLLLGLIMWRTVLNQVPQRWWVLLGLMVLAYIAIDLLSNRTPIRVFMSYATFSANTAYWRGLIFEHGLNNVWANPLFGLGFNDWVRPEFMYSASVDNFWLLMAMRYGIPAFLMLTAGIFIPLLRIMFRDFNGDARLTNIRLAWVFTFVGLSFTLATVHVWGNIFSLVFFMFGAGIWLISVEAKPSEQASSAAERRRGAGPLPSDRQQVAAEETAMDRPRAGGTRFSRFAPEPGRNGPAARGSDRNDSTPGRKRR